MVRRVRPVVRRDRLEAFPTWRQGVFAVGAGTRAVDASLLSRYACRSGNPPTIVFSLAWLEGRRLSGGIGVMERLTAS